MKARYIGNCVGWPPRDVHAPGGLVDMINSGRSISRATFTRKVDPVDRREVERALGYDHHFRITQDFHVDYQSGRLRGKRAYWIKHSAIEYVFQAP